MTFLGVFEKMLSKMSLIVLTNDTLKAHMNTAFHCNTYGNCIEAGTLQGLGLKTYLIQRTHSDNNSRL